MMMPHCQALDIIEQLVGEKCPTDLANSLVVNCKDGSTLTLIFTPPPDERRTVH
jgi:hypothetical protein